MPLNVVDNYGQHVGIIVAKYQEYFVVSTTDDTIDHYMDGFREQIKGKAAQNWQCKNVFGKINEEKFLASLKQWTPNVKPEFFSVEKTLDLYALNKEDISTYGLVKAFPSSTYILTKGSLMDDHYNIKLGLSYSRIPGLGVQKTFAAVVGDIRAVPEVSVPNHTTTLQVHSGDTDLELTLPGVIMCKKGEEIALELDFTSNSFTKVYTYDMIYNF